MRLVKTCDAWPEQYDVYEGDRQVGYLRLRHGSFTVECPDCGGEEVYHAYTHGDGLFDPDEREFHLNMAQAAISHWLARKAK